MRDLTGIRKKAVIMAAAVVSMCACGGSLTPVDTARTEAGHEEESFAVMETDWEKESWPSQGEMKEKEDSREEQVGIRGHVKEIHGDRILLGSDTDDFPGVFWVLGISEAASGKELQGGMSVFVLMEDMGSEAEDGIREYKALNVYEASEEETPKKDVLLTAPPVLGLSDPLSSTYGLFKVHPGNYSWNTEEGQGIIACGSGPLDEAAVKSGTKLKIPRYNGAEKVLYNYSMQSWPDKLTVRQWDASEAEGGEAEEERAVTFYCRMPFIELERGKIYEFAAEWKKQNLEKNGFWGNAEYSFVTE